MAGPVIGTRPACCHFPCDATDDCCSRPRDPHQVLPGHGCPVPPRDHVADGEQTSGEIATRTGLSASNTSRHLACLRECGLVESR
ncbi:MAG: helix-turn-helix domain-containing protein [Dehalococcoidia bacterium]|nr:helix-turn-helix domain-containing protein [Dehalococcoidia bacterium]